MKKIILSISILAAFGFSLNAQNVNIPDANFKAYLVGNSLINTNMDTEIQVTEANAFTGNINCPSQSIADLTGLEYFTSLTKLYCYNNFAISSIDVSMIPTLEHLFCSSNAITQLDVSNNPNLVFLACDDNDLTSLNVANGNNSNMPGGSFYANSNPTLSCIQVDDVAYSTSSWTNIDGGVAFSLNCNSCIVTIPDANFKAYLIANTAINTNLDTEIQCSEATAFTGGINCNNMSVSDMSGIEAFTSLTTLECSNNPIEILDLSNNIALATFYCNNGQLNSLVLPSTNSLTNIIIQNNLLTSLNISVVPGLTSLHINGNLLTNIDLSSNVELLALYCGNNMLADIDLSYAPNLIVLSIPGNMVTDLDLSNNPDLLNLDCSWNNLTALDVSTNIGLVTLRCYNNVGISSLDLSDNGALTTIECQDNIIENLNVANGNNTAITAFDATGNPATCIQVDNAGYSTANWTGIDVTASFSEDCGLGLIMNNSIEMNIYPNPASSLISIETEAVVNSISIFNITGKLVQTETTKSFSIQNLPVGVYIARISTPIGIQTLKFIKE